MRTQLIQQKVLLGSQVTFTLKTGEKVSGLLAEIGIDYITLNGANGQEILDVDEIKAIHLANPVEASGPSSSTLAPTEVNPQIAYNQTLSTSSDAPVPVEEPEPSDTTSIPTEASEPSDAAPVPVKEPEPSDTTSIPTEASEPSDAAPVPVKEPEPSDTDPDQIDLVAFEEQASEKLAEIVNRFNTEIQAAKLELEPPDLTFSEIAKDLKNWQNTDVYSKWGKIRNKYEYALKVGELSAEFGRIRPIVAELKSLVIRFPESTTLKRVLTYFYSILGNWEEALQNYQEAAVQSEEADYWFSVAVCALKLNKEELACYSLENFFYGVSILDKPKVWYAYVNLLEKFNNLPAFRELCKTDKYDVEDEEIEVLLETAIYLLQKIGDETLAAEIMPRWLTGESIKSLLGEACQKLDGKPAESYRQFLTAFMNAGIASEKKVVRIIPERVEHIRTVRQPTHRPKPQKQVTPRGDNLYREAKRADYIEKNLEKAERLYQNCIKQNIRRDSAIKDLAMVLVRLERPEEAVELLEDNRSKVKDKQSLDNTLITVYPAAAQYEKAIPLLNDSLSRAQKDEKRAQIRSQIASAYIKLGDYASAGNQFRQVLKLRPDNITVQRNLALCLSKQERYDEAAKILNQIQDASPDVKTAELLEAIARARTTGESILVDDIIIETGISDFSSELSGFAHFFLERCTFEGIPTGRVNDGKYTGSEKDVQYDIGRLEDIAKQLGTKRPRDRSNYYLSAARIYFDVEDDRHFFYRYLCRSFASRGDATVSENRHLDTAREWYCEALTLYDGDRGRRDEQDAVNSLVRYLFSTFGRAYIPLTPNIPSIDEAVEAVLRNHAESEKIFNAIAYLVLHSRYAANKVLRRLYENSHLRTIALDYLKQMRIAFSSPIEHWNDFIQLWNELRRKQFDKARTISNDLGFLNNFELTTAWLEDNIRLAEDVRSNLLFELDQQRVGELQRILETALELCRQVTFEERERLCFQLDTSCQTLRREIEESPTKLSVEDVYPITEVIQGKVNAYLKELHETSKPQMTIRLPVESYVPNPDRKIDVQIVVQNEKGRSPAESLELVIEGDKAFFTVTELDIKRDESLRGGEQSILKVPLRVTDEALDSQTFSLPIYARYRTRAGEQEETPVENLSVRLYSEDEFETIENPYAAYAEGGIVGDPAMFFGRDELIQNIAQAIQESRLQSKCVLVFGQKRSGKSSVLYHLKKALETDRKLLVLDLGNIGTLGEDSPVPLLFRILKRILKELEYAVEDRVDEGFPSVDLSIPGDNEFYNHPDPLQRFEDTFKSLKRQVSKREGWRGVRVVLLIDEFQYIYDRILADKIPESFMQNWKALLQANYFNAVLVGQDVMPKFKLRFPNEFGTTQDERVTYLRLDDARNLIDEPIRIDGRQGASRYRERAIERILDLTAGSPFYIQMLCNRLVEYMNAKHAGLVTEADVEQVKNELISGVNALDLDKFDNLINSGDTSADAILDEDALKVLKGIADNSGTGPCRRDRIDCDTSLPVDTILADLEKRDVVECREQSYRIRVELFKEWLIANG